MCVYPGVCDVWCSRFMWCLMIQVYVMWLHLIFTTLLPLVVLLVFNTRIYTKLVTVSESVNNLTSTGFLKGNSYKCIMFFKVCFWLTVGFKPAIFVFETEDLFYRSSKSNTVNESYFWLHCRPSWAECLPILLISRMFYFIISVKYDNKETCRAGQAVVLEPVTDIR